MDISYIYEYFMVKKLFFLGSLKSRSSNVKFIIHNCCSKFIFFMNGLYEGKPVTLCIMTDYWRLSKDLIEYQLIKNMNEEWDNCIGMNQVYSQTKKKGFQLRIIMGIWWEGDWEKAGN